MAKPTPKKTPVAQAVAESTKPSTLAAELRAAAAEAKHGDVRAAVHMALEALATHHE